MGETGRTPTRPRSGLTGTRRLERQILKEPIARGRKSKQHTAAMLTATIAYGVFGRPSTRELLLLEAREGGAAGAAESWVGGSGGRDREEAGAGADGGESPTDAGRSGLGLCGGCAGGAGGCGGCQGSGLAGLGGGGLGGGGSGGGGGDGEGREGGGSGSEAVTAIHVR